jgi:hypothetical protein
LGGQFSVGPECVAENVDVANNHLLTEDPVDSVSNLPDGVGSEGFDESLYITVLANITLHMFSAQPQQPIAVHIWNTQSDSCGKHNPSSAV